MGCDFCGKDWVQPCWDAAEASTCGNLTPADVDRAKKLAAAADKAMKLRRPVRRKPKPKT